MFLILSIALLVVSSLSAPLSDHYSFSPDVGGGSGTSFATEGEGRITAVRVWEINSQYITGIQLRYNLIWSEVVGRENGLTQEIILNDNEKIIQVSGKYQSNYIYQVIFVTSSGRSLIVGQPTQYSYNFYPIHPNGELILLSGRQNGQGITSLGAHWGVMTMDSDNSTDLVTFS